MTYTMSDAKSTVGAFSKVANSDLESEHNSSWAMPDPASSVLSPGAAPVLQLEATASVDPTSVESPAADLGPVLDPVPRWLNRAQAARRPEDKPPVAASTVVALASRQDVPGSAATSTSLTKIPEGWALHGNMVANNPVSIAGKLEGDVEITSGAVLTLEQTGAVEGTLTATGGITVAGRFKGHINAAKGSVKITDTAFVDGKVTYNRISMDGGQHRLELVYVDASDSTD